MKRVLFLLVTVMVMGLSFTSCTDNAKSKRWGGTSTIDLPTNQKLVTITWKGDQIWYLTKPMNSTDIVETYKFQEKSSWGVMEGTIVMKESKTK